MTNRGWIVLAGLALAGGCKKNTLNDVSRLEGLIESTLRAKGIEPTRVDCPDEVVVKEGGQFDCSVEVAGGHSYTVTATMSNVSGGNVDIVPEIAGDPVVAALLEQDLAPKIGERTGKAARIRCAEPLLVPTDQGEVRCDLTLDGEPRRILVVVNDEREVERWEVEPR
jgi:hypothetical protein